jgi:hypothetical protein
MEGTMNKTLKKTMFWSPRIAAILFALFISLFALDVFQEDMKAGEVIVGLLIHLIPTFVMAIAIILAWRWEWVGAVVFAGWAVLYITIARDFHWSVYAIIAGIPFVIGTLYLLDWIYRKEIRAV